MKSKMAIGTDGVLFFIEGMGSQHLYSSRVKRKVVDPIQNYRAIVIPFNFRSILVMVLVDEISHCILPQITENRHGFFSVTDLLEEV